ncbi:MAG TPA: DUF6600 domain-containing protein [Casimicrobiaceae bacterium]|jgi:hypothetical protein
MLGWLSAVLIVTCGAGAVPARADDDLPTRVGRVSDFGGELYLAPQDRPTEWATVGVNYPVTSGDNLWVAPDGRAEIDFGSGQLRVAGDTNLQVSALDEHRFALYVASGRVILRIRTLEPGDNALVDTPYAHIQIDRPGLYRIDVAPERQQTLLIVREGEAHVDLGGRTQQVLPGQMATIGAADPANIALQTGFGSDGFDAWSAVRDRRYDNSTSARYVSSEMVGATDLDGYGAWESYATYGNVWFPTTVAVGWAPYRFGRWAWVGPWGWTWVDDAPWGYAPFHYGRWIWLSGRWGWCPGAFVRRPVWAPALVAWFGGPEWAFSTNFGAPVYGWVPLSWGDPFWPHWRCSASCRRTLNHPFAVDAAERPGRVPARFANSELPAAVTWVPGHVLTGGKPVAVNLVRPSSSMLSSAPVLGTATIARGNPPAMISRPGGAPPPAGLLRRGPSASTSSAVANAPLTSAPGQALPRAPAAPTPDKSGRARSVPPPREITPAPQALRGASVPAARVYGGVTDGRGAYTGVVPTPGPKLPATVDRGSPVPPTMIYPVVPAAPPAMPSRVAPVVPEVRHVNPREAGARNVPVPGANPTAGVTPAPAGLGSK